LDKQRLRERMREQGLGGLLLTSPENVFYTTGYTALPSSGNPILYTLRNRLPFFSYIDGDGTITLLCWGFSAEGVDFGADRLVGFNDAAGALRAVSSVVGQALPAGQRLGIESTCPIYLVTLLQEQDLLGQAPVVADSLLASLRLIKSPEEIALLKKSTEIIETTVAELYGLLHLGMSRLELMHEARHRMIRNGAMGISHITFSFAGANPEVAIDETLEAHRLATLDLGAIYEGYCSDNRRYAYCGQAPDSLLDRYAAMVEIVDAVGNALVPGARYADLYQLAIDLFARHDVPLLGRFSHVGHNIGLETEEQWLDDDPVATVQAGMVINIELYSHAPTGEQIGNEETYVIQETGPIRISTLPRQIRLV
jgi:Xaa-Pro aminopeptidase